MRSQNSDPGSLILEPVFLTHTKSLPEEKKKGLTGGKTQREEKKHVQFEKLKSEVPQVSAKSTNVIGRRNEETGEAARGQTVKGLANLIKETGLNLRAPGNH